jgi:hypothetical protein
MVAQANAHAVFHAYLTVPGRSVAPDTAGVAMFVTTDAHIGSLLTNVIVSSSNGAT